MEVVSSTPGWHWGNCLEIKCITVFYCTSQSIACYISVIKVSWDQQ